VRAPLFTGLAAFVAIGAGGAAAFVLLSTLAMGFVDGGLPAWLVNTLCYLLLIGPVYLLHRRISFASDAPHGRALPRYVAVQLMALLLTALFSQLAHGVFALPALPAAILVVGLTSGVNFLVLRGWAFASGQWGAERQM
jgi:putative flippase GtrA